MPAELRAAIMLRIKAGDPRRQKPHIIKGEPRGKYPDVYCRLWAPKGIEGRTVTVAKGRPLPPGVCAGCRKAALREGALVRVPTAPCAGCP